MKRGAAGARGLAKAVVFDMDGLLIDSEPLWRRAEREIFASVGLELTDAQCHETTGLRIDEVVDYWNERHPFAAADWKSERFRLANAIVQRVEELVRGTGTPMPGVESALGLVRSTHVPIGLATSSARSLIGAVFDALDRQLPFPMAGCFQVICSATDEKNGKPAPDVYLTATSRLGVEPGSCIAIEDSNAGIESAQRAGMRVIAVRAAGVGQHRAADHELRSLDHLALEHLQL